MQRTSSPLSLSLSLSALLLAVSAPLEASPPNQEASPSSRALSAQGKQLIEDLGALRFERLGHPAVRWDHTPPVYASAERPHTLLVVPVRFPDRDFERFKGTPNQAERLQAYYQELLFDPEYKRPNTLSHYFATQSYGQYHLQGLVLPPVTLSNPRAHYGRPKRPEGGSWRNDTDAEGLVEEVLAQVGLAHPHLNWEELDRWDPNDIDGDGERAEPDGYLDHLVMVYAGGGQSSCQGLYKLQNKLNPNVGPEVFDTLTTQELECADRIWPHRFMVQRREGQGPSVNGVRNPRGGVPIREGLWARDYNMQSEYTEPSTFIHEFGHSIGLPDVYARQTNNSTGPWELMSSTASPSPQGLSAWSRVTLGWLKPTVIFPPEADGAESLNASLVTLDQPPHRFERVVAPALASAKQVRREASQAIKPALESEGLKEASQALTEAGEALKEGARELKEDVINPAQDKLKGLSARLEKAKETLKDKMTSSGLTQKATEAKEAISKATQELKEATSATLQEVKAELKALAPTRALLIALPPQPKVIQLTTLEERHGDQALYSGQGNELNRDVTLSLDLSALPQGAPVFLTMDAWWEIEAGWDFAYVEARRLSKDPKTGASTPSAWARLVDKAHMPAKHGHDGPTSLPGFTGRSGDHDGDGKNEHSEGCDPSAPVAHGDERTEASPCERPTWSEGRFDLSAYAGAQLEVRVRYFTDTAAVERGLLLDNLMVRLNGQSKPLFYEDFEGELNPALSLNGFLKSTGQHRFEVPHFYLVERRDPYVGSADPKSADFRYDSALSKARPIFGYDLKRAEMGAVRLRARPGALVWYINGAYAWSENEPTQNGPGRGFLLAIDANPNELKLPGLEGYYQGSPESQDTRYELSAPEAQEALKKAALKTICFVRSPWSYPRDLPQELFYTCSGSQLPSMRVESKTPMFSYEVINTLLPGEARTPYLRVSELYDFKERKGKVTWSLRDRALRSLHTLDAPFSSVPFEGGLEYLTLEGNTLKVSSRHAHPAVSVFDDAARWQNKHLRFGGVEVPSYGLTLTFTDTPTGSDVKVSWR